MQTKERFRGCLFSILLVLGGAGATGALFYYAAQDIKGVVIAVECPVEVNNGQTFPLLITVMNERPRGVLRVSDIDIADEYLAGFSVLSIDPIPKSTQHVPIDNSLSYKFDHRIQPGESKTFIFTLRAQIQGDYRGEVDVCEGIRFVTAVAETMVLERE